MQIDHIALYTRDLERLWNFTPNILTVRRASCSTRTRRLARRRAFVSLPTAHGLKL